MVIRIFLIYGLICVVAALFFVKFYVQKLNKKLVLLEAEITREQDNIHIMSAEIAHLSRPERLVELSSKYLDLQPAKDSQIVVIELGDGGRARVFDGAE